MIKLSELQTREIIMIETGKRLGYISDLEIDPELGKITAIIIYLKEGKSSLFGKSDELIVYWDQIVTIGDEVILVNEVTETYHATLE